MSKYIKSWKKKEKNLLLKELGSRKVAICHLPESIPKAQIVLSQWKHSQNMLFALLISPCMQCGRNFQKLWPDSLISLPYNNVFPESNVYVGICDFLNLKQKVFQILLSKEISDTWIQDCNFFYIILCAWVFGLQICLQILCMPNAIGGQKRASDLSGTNVDRQLWTAMWGLGIKSTLVVLKSSNCS